MSCTSRPLIGPRMFPQNPESPFFECDKIYSKEEVASLYSRAIMIDLGLSDWGEGINTIDA